MLEESVSSSPTFWAGLYSWFTPTVFFVLLQLVIGTIYITSSFANNNGTNHKQQHEQEHPQGSNFTYPQQQQLVRSPSMLQRLKSINFYSYPYRSQDPLHHNHIHNTPSQQFHSHEREEQTQLARSPSMLQKLKSINLYSYFPTESFSSKLSTTDTNVLTTTTTSHETHEAEKRHVAVVESEGEEEQENDDVLGQIEHNNLKGYEEGSSMDEIYLKLQQGQEGHFTRSQSDTKPSSGEVPVKLPRKMKKSASSKSAFSHFKEDDIVESRRPATVREAKVTADEDDEEVDAKANDFINKFKQDLKLQRLNSIMRYKETIGRGHGK